jgi:hypothetical protein
MKKNAQLFLSFKFRSKMLVNFCTTQFQPIFECSQMQLEGYQAENLAKDFSQK